MMEIRDLIEMALDEKDASEMPIVIKIDGDFNTVSLMGVKKFGDVKVFYLEPSLNTFDDYEDEDEDGEDE